jgi:hypothetical protein
MKDTVNLQLSKIKDGALQEKFEREMSKVLDNLLDQNTDPTKKRKVQINIEFVTDKERELMKTQIEVKSTLAPQNPVFTNILFGEDDEGIVANELVSGAPGQTFIDPDDGFGPLSIK